MSQSITRLSALKEGAALFDIELSSRQLSQFSDYQELLLEWNQRISLTAVTGHEAVQIRHFLDSLSCVAATGNLTGQSLIDVGTGAGFPGLPLKILFPELDLTLIESVGKKVRFLNLVAGELGLSGVEIVAERAEVVGQDPAYREKYDWAVSRGVAKIAVLVEYLLPLCRIGGHALAQKGGGTPSVVSAANQAIEVLGGGNPDLRPIDLPGTVKTHFLVVIPKVAPTPEKYPRRPGMPSKRPL